MADFRAFTIEYPSFADQLLTDYHLSKLNPAGASGGKSKKLFPFQAMWDTGANGSIISKNVANQLQLKPTGEKKLLGIGGIQTVNEYLLRVHLPNEVGIITVDALEGGLDGFDILIGMDIINQGDFAITQQDGRTCFSFRMPSLEKIDFPKGKNA